MTSHLWSQRFIDDFRVVVAGGPDRAESLDAKLLLRMLWVSVTATAAALTCFCPILVSKVTECGAEWRRRHIHHIQPARNTNRKM